MGKNGLSSICCCLTFPSADSQGFDFLFVSSILSLPLFILTARSCQYLGSSTTCQNMLAQMLNKPMTNILGSGAVVRNSGNKTVTAVSCEARTASSGEEDVCPLTPDSSTVGDGSPQSCAHYIASTESRRSLSYRVQHLPGAEAQWQVTLASLPAQSLSPVGKCLIANYFASVVVYRITIQPS